MQTGTGNISSALQRASAHKNHDAEASTGHHGADAGTRRGRGYGNARNCRTFEISCRAEHPSMDGHFRLAI